MQKVTINNANTRIYNKTLRTMFNKYGDIIPNVSKLHEVGDDYIYIYYNQYPLITLKLSYNGCYMTSHIMQKHIKGCYACSLKDIKSALKQILKVYDLNMSVNNVLGLEVDIEYLLILEKN